MEKEFVTYEQALALYELGVYIQPPVYCCYQKTPVLMILPSAMTTFDIIAPLKQQVFRWFRENHGWIGGIRQLSQSGNGMIIGEFRKDEDNSFMMFAETYEQCENYCIENLIKMVKPQDNG